ncbi:MAG TPA: 8-amino-7-oxononanoate synthase [Stellaceae bacterium]|jgi:8-amino-7-oxononanoate synthase|nr:8-amino-7-oxononanoate synthase [Stellaceae bacterium]
MRSLDEFAAAKLRELDLRHRRRALSDSARDGVWVERDGRRLLSFSCNDYLNLSQHPAVRAAAIAAIRDYGAGAGASRLVTGNHPLYRALETRLAQFKGTEAACIFGSGYLANIGIIPALIGRADLVLIDALAHACLWAGARMSGAAVLSFRHNDSDHLAELLARERARHRHAMVATEGVFSMDGDRAPLPTLAAIAEAHDSWLLVDDAHGLGVLGNGRGSSFAADPPVTVPLQMGTLSKALGSYGGYLCASAPVVELMASRARSLIYSTALPPASVAAALAALDVIATEPALTAMPLAKARRFTALTGLPEAQSAIVPVIIGDEAAALAASRLLDSEGFLVAAIRPPTVPEGTARLRLTFCAQHPDAAIERLAALIRTRILR